MQFLAFSSAQTRSCDTFAHQACPGTVTVILECELLRLIIEETVETKGSVAILVWIIGPTTNKRNYYLVWKKAQIILQI